jgi:hypothetical protein
MLSNFTYALTCLAGFGFNSLVPGVCVICQANCSSCYNLATNCTDCYPGYFLYDDNITVSCTSPCPPHHYIDSTGNFYILNLGKP